jgi:glycosyltransferase involved in cell wall biosynthesis
MRVGIVHERFTEYGGSEKVVEEFFRLWPEARIFTAICDYGRLPTGIPPAAVTTSVLQHIYRGRGGYAHLLPLIPLAMAAMRLPSFDLLITSHHAFASQVGTRERSKKHLLYVHTPARWVWDQGMLEGETGGHVGEACLRAFGTAYRRWDFAAAQRPDIVLANSTAVRERIRQWWGRESTVVHPPVDTEFFRPGHDGPPRGDFFLYAGRLVPYKRPEVAVQAATQLGVPLIVTGAGRSRKRLEELAGPTVEFRGRVSDVELRELYRSCRALLHPGVEDFGITAVEVQACGAPVIAQRAGGAIDTVAEGLSGVLYDLAAQEAPVTSLMGAIEAFCPQQFDTDLIVKHAAQFSRESFSARIKSVVDGD